MPNSPAVDIANRIIANGIGHTIPDDPSLPLVRAGFEPDENNRILLTVYDTPGPAANPRWERDYPRIQVRVKASDEWGYNDAFNTQQQVKDLLLGTDRFVVINSDMSETLYVGIWTQVDIASLAPDYNKRPILVATYRMVREYPTTNREKIE